MHCICENENERKYNDETKGPWEANYEERDP